MRHVLLAAACLLLVACMGSFERNAPEPRIYRLSAPALVAGTAAEANLVVLMPAVAPGIDSERIASLWPGNRLDYYAGARWSGGLARVTQGALVEAIGVSGRVTTVEADPGRFRATHVLGLEVLRFEADYTGGDVPVARVVMNATLARYGDRRALASWSAAGEVPASANTLAAVTTALDAAFGRAAAELVGPALDALARDVAGQP